MLPKSLDTRSGNLEREYFANGVFQYKLDALANYLTRDTADLDGIKALCKQITAESDQYNQEIIELSKEENLLNQERNNIISTLNSLAEQEY